MSIFVLANLKTEFERSRKRENFQAEATISVNFWATYVVPGVTGGTGWGWARQEEVKKKCAAQWKKS